jgi:LuxR family transcriptional regulator, maltose regulon positive regulatory protein
VAAGASPTTGQVDERTSVAGPPGFPFRHAKLRPPPLRSGIVERSRLVERLLVARAPAAVICAPAGYGKTVSMVQAFERDPRQTAWLTVDEHDNDPVVLMSYVASALQRAYPADDTPFSALTEPGPWASGHASAHLRAGIESFPTSFCLMLDDVHRLWNPTCVDAVYALPEAAPAGSTIMIATREDPGERVARPRAMGALHEVSFADLAMDQAEASSLLRAAGMTVSDQRAADLTDRSEGWPAILYLLALATRAGGADAASSGIAGDDRFLADYLHTEFLESRAEEEVGFLLRTSVLSSMTGAMCDAVLGMTGSTELLDSLGRSNLPLIPLDHDRRWYRYHHLFREMLRAELEAREPGTAAALHLEAARWLEEEGIPESGIDHALEGGDVEAAVRLIGTTALTAYREGRIDTVQRWFERLDDRALIEAPYLAIEAAWMYAVTGRPIDAERCADLAERGRPDAPIEGGTTIEGLRAGLRAAMCRGGPAQVMEDALLAGQLEPGWSRWRASSMLMLGLAHVVHGDGGSADKAFEACVDVAIASGSVDDASTAAASRASIAMNEGRWADAATHAEAARSIVIRSELEHYSTSGLTFAACARVAAHRGSLDEARRQVARASGLRSMLTYALPGFAVRLRVDLAQVHLALSQPELATELLHEIDAILWNRPALGAILDDVESLRDKLRLASFGGATALHLTAAELRLLPFLPTHLSFAEIAGELFVSRSTVKTQAISIYRKLGVSSRSDAIDRARSMGLLQP